MLLPPLSCLIFQHAAEKYAYEEAIHDLDRLQQNILPLMQNIDPGEFAPSPDTAGSAGNFLFQISSYMRKTAGNAKLIIFESRMRVIYPRDELEREMITPLAADFKQYILENKASLANGSTELKSSDGQAYLVNIYTMPMESAQAKYVVAYSPVSKIGSWVRDASILVLIISSVFALLVFVVLWLAIRSITHPLHKLCREVEQIGNGSFSEIEPSFQLKELEDLRLSMNQMSGQLLHSEEVQRDFFQNVSHELRNPLMSISGYAQGIEQERFDSPKDAARTILTESKRLTELVNSLLTLSRMEGDPNSPVLNSVTVIDSIEELEDLRLSMNQMSGQLLHSEEVQRDFFQNVSHELRNPLMSISGYAQGIEQERFDSPKDAARTILTESKRLTELVNSLLTLSRMEGDPNSPVLNSVTVIDSIEECLDRINGLALKKEIAVSLLPFDETICAFGDEELICRVLENLLTNAIRYAKTVVTVSVTVEKELLCISVSDNGEGISEKDLPHIFERCYKGRGGNFGIGLAIARSAAQKMGGTLNAANAPSGGAVFTLRLKKR